jgi:predicted transcriptional regulator
LTILVINHREEQILRVDKRNKFEIYYDLLDSLRTESSNNARFSLTRAARQTNLPYNRFQKTLSMLVNLDLCVKEGSEFVVTEKGREYLSEYRKINEFFRRMGFYL